MINPSDSISGATVEKTEQHIRLAFDQPRPVLSSAVLNGGFYLAHQVLNLRVDRESDTKESPQTTLTRYCQHHRWSEQTVGMMTAAAMNSFRQFSTKEQGVELSVIVTTGLENARAAGDPADWNRIEDQAYAFGTINTIVLSSASLTPAAMVEVVAVATEAKAAAMRQLDVVSQVSGEIATGTGTDAIAVVSGDGPSVSYCGKHTLLGELLAKGVMQTIKESVNYQ